MDLLDIFNSFICKNWPDYTTIPIYNIYLFGSRYYLSRKFLIILRLHNIHTPNSDYDYISIIGGKYFPGPQLIEKDDVNINFYHVDYWKSLLDDNVVWLMSLNWIPEKYLVQPKLI